VTAIGRYRAVLLEYCNLFPDQTMTPVIAEMHNFQLPLLCQLSKSAPNILWSVGSSVHNQFLLVGSGNPAVMAARISLKSMLKRHNGRARPALDDKAFRA
jgi:hypothetical protein